LLGVVVLVACFFGGIYQRFRWKELGELGVSLFLVVVGAYCVMAPGRPYGHYLLLMILPVSFFALVTAKLLLSRGDRLEQRSREKVLWGVTLLWLLGGVFSQFLTTPGMGWNERPFGWLEKQANPWKPGEVELTWRRETGARPLKGSAPIQSSEVAAAIRKLGYAGEGLSVWGWMNEVNVEAGMYQGTRDGLIWIWWMIILNDCISVIWSDRIHRFLWMV